MVSLNMYVNSSFLNASSETCMENRSNFEYERRVHTIFDCLRDRILLEGEERGEQYTREVNQWPNHDADNEV